MSKLDILSKDESLNKLCMHILKAFSRSAEVLRQCTTSADKTSTQNEFGDHQLAMDLQCENIILEELTNSGECSYAMSEETTKPIKCGGSKWIVTFDPLDGSSIIGNNFSIGTIVGIWPHDDDILIGKTGRAQVSAANCLFGSRTSVVFYNQVKDNVEEYTLMNAGTDKEFWQLTKSDIKIKKSGKIFAPGNTRCMMDNPAYREVVDYWIHNGYTLRYSGGMAADIHQIFMKGEGVFSCMGTDDQPSKLRYIYEVAPLAFLVEKAGGAHCMGSQPILDQKVENYVQRSQIVVGCEDEIKFVQSVYEKWAQRIKKINY